MATKVLVVDDEKMIVKGIRFSLLQDGYDVDTAYDGDEALQKASENKYDIILLDVIGSAPADQRILLCSCNHAYGKG